MGFLSKLFHRKSEDDISNLDIKSHVLGSDYDSPEGDYNPPPMLPEFRNEGPPLPEIPRQKPFANPYRQSQSQNFNEPAFSEQNPNFADKDINDSLRMIETQLMAIRAQTETINERIKNLEFALKGRPRY